MLAGIAQAAGQVFGRDVGADQQAQRIDVLRLKVGLAGDVGLGLTQGDLGLAQIGQRAIPPDTRLRVRSTLACAEVAVSRASFSRLVSAA
jgi:hypothetical protein